MLRIGVIGAGKWGSNHIRVFQELQSEGMCELIGFSDRDRDKKWAFGCQYYESYKELLKFVDAVSIAVPTDMHYEVVKDCLLAGKHVLVEKPITLNSEEAGELIKISERENLILASGYIYRFNPAVLKLKERISEFGTIHNITMRYIHSHKPPRRDSGVIFNLASHLFDILLFLIGVPKKLVCMKTNYISEEREDSAVILADYGDFYASLEVSWLHPLKRRDAWIIASERKVYVDFLEQKMVEHFIEVRQEETINRGFADVKIDKKEPLKEELKHFIVCSERGKKPVNDAFSAYIVTKLCEIALKSVNGSMMEVKI